MKLFWGHSYQRIVGAVVCLSIALFLVSALASFCWRDPSFFYHIAGDHAPIYNMAGAYGSYTASLLLYLFGVAAWCIVALVVLEAFWLFDFITRKYFIRNLVAFSLLCVGISLYCACSQHDLYVGIMSGGLFGRSLRVLGLLCVDEQILLYITGMFNFLGILMLIQFRWVQPIIVGVQNMIRTTRCEAIVTVVVAACKYSFQRAKGMIKYSYKPDRTLDNLVQRIVTYDVHGSTAQEPATEIFDDPFWNEFAPASEMNIEQSQNDLSIALTLNEQESVEEPFAAPGSDLFKKVSKAEGHETQTNQARVRARHLEAKLELFGIRGKVVSITAGPVVTLFEYAPADDVKVSKILALEDDLSLALEAHSLRIIAPIPGRAVVGFEVANTMRQMVFFADVAAGPIYQQHKGPLPLIIGRDTVGNDVVCDVTDMPHLLVAGSTGSGKSVALNSMLVSLLCKAHPDEVNLILIDPKRLEFSAFADVAHLIFPIVTDVIRVPLVLRWAVMMMEERYARLAEVGVRHVTEYHKKYGISAMPYTVIVIDEFADLMMVAGKEVEELIARLAQMARAAGIHLIIATQRPSVDVITGLIKVNFPSRIACKVISKVDSRTILDCAGAEKLLGKGDMLFLNQKGILARMHGAYVKDEEIIAVVDAIKKQRQVMYQELNIIEAAENNLEYAEDPLYPQVSEYVLTQDHVSISLLQRKFRIGYNRSARLIDTLEARGMLMPADGSKFRKVLRI